MNHLKVFRRNKSNSIIAVCFIYIFIAACNGGNGGKEKTSTNDSLSNQKNLSEVDTSNTVAKAEMEDPEEEEQDLKGKIITDLRDTTLLKLVYGSYKKKGNEFFFNLGAQIWDKADSIYMKVAERLGDDSTKLIYIRGEAAITDVMHNHYYETKMLFNKIKTGWEVKDYDKDEEVIDYSMVEMAGIYNNRLLVKYQYSGVFAGGVLFADDCYSFLSRDSLNAPSVEFISESSNTASNQCDSVEYAQTKTSCDCYTRGGEVTYVYNKKLKCIVFNYNFENTLMDCGRINPKHYYAHQTWYMNADTSFQAKGNRISEWGDSILKNVNLTDVEISKRLNYKLSLLASDGHSIIKNK